MNPTICILGAAGFVGARALRKFADRGRELRVLEHRRGIAEAAGMARIRGAADDPAALDRALVPGAVAVNFVYGGAPDARRIAQAIGAACSRREVRRLVHVSTTDVYGTAKGAVLDERSPCEPATEYERAKHDCEEIVAAAAGPACELVILRPTAVFGPGGRNLESLALRVLRHAWARRWLRACVMGRRRMHVVDVEGVAAATAWAASAPLEQRAEKFIVSQDDEPGNDYASLEAFFVSQFGAARYPLPPLALPRVVHGVALRLAGRSVADPQRCYSGAKLATRGFRAPRPFAEALAEYAAWVRGRLEHA